MVAAGMTIFVVDCLEMVHADEQHRNRLPVALGLSEAAHQPLVDGAAIERAGQGVEYGRAAQLDGAPRLVDTDPRKAHALTGTTRLLGGYAFSARGFEQPHSSGRRCDRPRDLRSHSHPPRAPPGTRH